MVSQLGIIFLVVLTVIFNALYWKIPSIKQTFFVPVFFMILANFLGALGAYFYFNQPFILSLWAQKSMLLYFTYFLLHIIKLPVKQIENMMIMMAVAYVAFYVLQYVAYPIRIISTRIDYDRGTVRIFIPGIAFLIFAYYRSLQEFYYRKSMKDVLLVVATLAILILLGSRATMAIAAFTTASALIFGRQIKSKVVLYILIAVAMVALYFIFEDIFSSLFELSSEESETAEDNVRLRGINFFLYEFPKSPLAYITGSGLGHENSQYGLYMKHLTVSYGYFQGDIGIIGEYSRYGIFLVIGGLIMFMRILFYKYDNTKKYFRYLIISSLLSIALGFNLTASYAIITLCIMMYTIDVLEEEKRNAPKKKPVVYFEQLEQDNSNTKIF